MLGSTQKISNIASQKRIQKMTGITTDRNDPELHKIQESGQQAAYLVLTEEERAKGFTRPVRKSYLHVECGQITTMGQAIAETYARNPKFYNGTFCCNCKKHFPLTKDGQPAFLWYPDRSPVGS